MSKPSIVVVPGAWHVPAHFDHVSKRLEAAGCLTGIEVDVSAVQVAVLAQLDAQKDVVVVTHSYGSIPSTAALAGLGTTARKAAGKSGGVTAIVIISGFLLPPKSTMLAIMGGQLHPQYLREDDATLPFAGPGAIHVLYDDLDHNEALKAVWRLKPQSSGVNTSNVPDQVAGIADILLSYLMCSNDNAVPWAAQTVAVSAFRSAGVRVHAEVAESDHSPFLKVPEGTANFIRQAAGELVETCFPHFNE